MLKEFWCNRCSKHLTQDLQSKKHLCCTTCELTINKNKLMPKVDKPVSFLRIAANTDAWRKIDRIVASRELELLISDSWMLLD